MLSQIVLVNPACAQSQKWDTSYIADDTNDMTNRLVGLMARGMPGLPFDIQEIAAEAKHGSLTVDLADNKPLIATIEAKDKEGAERLKLAADALVALGRTRLPQMRLQLDKQVKNGFGEDDFGAAMKEQIKLAQIGLEHAAAVLEGTTIESQGNQVEIQVTVMGGSVDGARALVQSFFGLRWATRVEEEIPLPKERPDGIDE